MSRIFLVLSLFLFACCSDSSNEVKGEGPHLADDLIENNDSDSDTDVDVKSDYDMQTVDADNREEFKENLAKIEKEHGEQWDFCTCVVKNDSINKAFQMDQSDKEFDRLSERFDEIDGHCKAFLVQSPNATPEERAKHEKKVKKCLQNAK